MRHVPFRGLVTLCLFLAFCASAHAQTWVSGVGDDANPGSRTAPCKTFAGAISKTAASGEIDALDPGGFGAVTITKSITIDGRGNLASVLVAGTNGIIVQAGPADVVILRRLSLVAPGSGINAIRFVSGGQLIIEDCTINGGFTTHGIDVNLAATGKVTISNTTIHNCAQAGVHVVGTGADVSLNDVTVTNCANGVDVVSGFVDVNNSVLTQNTSAGIFGEGGTLNSANNILAGNGQDVLSLAGAVVNLTSNYVALGLALAADTTTVTVPAGQPATYAITATPPPGGFTSPVTFSCSGLPANLTYAFTPATGAAGTAPVTTSLVVSMVGSAYILSLPRLPSPPLGLGFSLVALAGVLWLSLRTRGTRRPQLASAFSVALLVVGVGMLCTASSIADPARTSSRVPATVPFTVTATSGSMSVSQQFSVTMQ